MRILTEQELEKFAGIVERARESIESSGLSSELTREFIVESERDENLIYTLRECRAALRELALSHPEKPLCWCLKCETRDGQHTDACTQARRAMGE